MLLLKHERIVVCMQLAEHGLENVMLVNYYSGEVGTTEDDCAASGCCWQPKNVSYAS